MASSPRSALRTIEILDFLAAHPRVPFTLSELCRRLALSPSSAHAVLGVLAEAGYLTRDPSTKAYSLGPSAVALGSAALEVHPAIALARDELRALSEDVGAATAATAVLGDDLVIVATGRHVPGSAPSTVGQRVRHVPPLGIVHFAFGDDEEIAAWLRLLPSDVTAEERDRHVEAVDVVRSRGYSVALAPETLAGIGRTLARLADEPRAAPARADLDSMLGRLAHEDAQLDTIDTSATHVVNHVAAPVFDTHGCVSLVFYVVLPPEPVAGDDILRIAARTVAAAQSVTIRTHGHRPGLVPATAPPQVEA